MMFGQMYKTQNYIIICILIYKLAVIALCGFLCYLFNSGWGCTVLLLLFDTIKISEKEHENDI